MKKIGWFFVSLVSTLFLTGCIHSPAPAMVSFVEHSGTGTHPVNNSVRSIKTGSSSCHAILMLVSFGDCSISAAQKNGGIQKVHSVDNASTQIFYLYGKYTTIVHGE